MNRKGTPEHQWNNRRDGDDHELMNRCGQSTRPETSHFRSQHAVRFMRQDSSSSAPLHEDDLNNLQMEEHVAEIVRCMEEDEALMENNPISEHLRMETLRDMPQCLTMKRCIKAKLMKSVNRKCKHRPLGCFKRFKYQISMTFTKFQITLHNLIYSFELWYNSLKAIEGHFGSGVATYFKFLRWIFVMNLLISVVTMLFVVIPQITYQPSAVNQSSGKFLDENNRTVYADFFAKEKFSFIDIISGEGFLSSTVLFYGFYTNGYVTTLQGTSYNMKFAYFFTMLCLYVAAFVVLSVSMAKSYRHSFIETSGGLKNVYAHKIFCGWDYSIATKEGAELKAMSIYNELKELLSDDNCKPRKMTFFEKFWTRGIQIILNLFIILFLLGTALLMWALLNKHLKELKTSEDSNVSLITAVIVTVIMTLGPIFFSWIIKFEDYKNPRTVIYVSLVRTFCLEMVVIGVLVLFWLSDSNEKHCWQTLLGQEIYRLILIDFIISVIFISLIDFLRHLIYKFVWKRIGVPEFDIACHTLQIIYNQTLFWVGFYFSPLLAVIVTLKCWFIWYIKRGICLYCCKPSNKSWRAAQTQTIFLVMTFLALFAVIIVHVYIITHVKTGSCGPFRDSNYTLDTILSMDGDGEHFLMQFVQFLMKPGVITGFLIAMGVRVYYVRAKSKAEIGMVTLLRDMLVVEAKDKEFLLTNISKITNGTWMYNLRNTHKRRHVHVEQRASDDRVNRRLPTVNYNDPTPTTATVHNENRRERRRGDLND